MKGQSEPTLPKLLPTSVDDHGPVLQTGTGWSSPRHDSVVFTDDAHSAIRVCHAIGQPGDHLKGRRAVRLRTFHS